MNSFLKYYHTLKHLKPVQIYGRFWFRLYRPKPDLRPAPARAAATGPWVQPALRPPSLTGPRTFDHLNEEHNLPQGQPWNIRKASHLWNYHLHYFDDLVAEGCEERRDWHLELIESWVRDNEPGSSPGWDPYPISRRVVNWIKAELAAPVLNQRALDSLAAQTRYLFKKPEHHLQGNHLWANAKAMVFAGLFFGGKLKTEVGSQRSEDRGKRTYDRGQSDKHRVKNPEAGQRKREDRDQPLEAGDRRPEAERWLKKGLKLVRRELDEQVRADGSHFEQSPMYHALMLEDLLDLINLGRAFGWQQQEAWTGTASRMLGYLQAVCHPDWQLALLNDSALNMAPSPQRLMEHARRLGIEPESRSTKPRGMEHFRDSGLVRVEQGAWTLFFDTGPIGPDYIPGHAHADSLTFELSLHGKRLIVDSGTGMYGTSERRQEQRSTAAHNTIRVDRADSSEVWSGFRVARRARPLGAAIVSSAKGQVACQAGHDGYVRLPGKVLHERTIGIDTRGVVIQDYLRGHGKHEIELFLHFHPDFSLEDNGEGLLLLERTTGDLRARISFSAIDACFKEAYIYSPEFGLFLRAECLRLWSITTLPWRLQTFISMD